ncbi:hypothetical protein ACEWY4_025351 [Coilia grayii]|uniref:Fibronectin type-III domain-containing protein n=1 Tax=Coilia grayii TaxID=363190 RepID=A0ABD1IXC3_9TELE
MLNVSEVPPLNTTENQSQWFDGIAPWFLSNNTDDTWFSFFDGRLPWSRWSNGDAVTFHNWYPGRPIPKPMPESENCDPNANTHMCPQLEKLLQCVDNPEAKDALNRNALGQTSTESPNTTSFSETQTLFDPSVTVPTISVFGPSTDVPTVSPPSVSPCPNRDPIEADLNKFVEDACLVLLNFGLWWERNCSEDLPYICYDDRFHGEVNVFDITYTSASLSWLEAPGAISGYRVEVKSDQNNWTNPLTSNLTSELQNLTAGTKYTVYVFPVKCERDLNPQKISFYSQPDFIQNLTVPTNEIQETSVTLYWLPPAQGGVDFYRVCLRNTSSDVTCKNITAHHQTKLTKHTISHLEPGGTYIVEVSAEVADMSIPGRRFNQTFYTRPRSVENLSYRNYNTTWFMVEWDPPSVGTASTYHVHMAYTNGTLVHEVNSSLTTYQPHSPLKPGYEFTITVKAQVNAYLEGNPKTIQAFTDPDPVKDLTLTVTGQTIDASWMGPDNGQYQNFSVTLCDPDRCSVSSNITHDHSRRFSNLKAGAQYTVKVLVLGVGNHNSTVKETSAFTSPNAPRNFNVTSKNKSCISLGWDVPDQSENVTILYNVSYTTTFWGRSGENYTSSTSYTWCGLEPGTTFDFFVKVFAGNQYSQNVTVQGETDPDLRNITISILCGSSDSLGCNKEGAKSSLLQEVRLDWDWGCFCCSWNQQLFITHKLKYFKSFVLISIITAYS